MVSYPILLSSILGSLAVPAIKKVSSFIDRVISKKKTKEKEKEKRKEKEKLEEIAKNAVKEVMVQFMPVTSILKRPRSKSRSRSRSRGRPFPRKWENMTLGDQASNVMDFISKLDEKIEEDISFIEKFGDHAGRIAGSLRAMHEGYINFMKLDANQE